MELTPIKIPGKRKRDSKGSKRKNVVTSRRQYLIPGRPPNIEPLIDRKAHRRFQKPKHTRLSILESLPTEVIERIFLFCLNVNLPTSSPVISGKLSCNRVYVQAIKQAFGPTWEYSCKDHTGKLYLKRADNAHCIPGDHKLQSVLIRCRWATLEILRRAEMEWLRTADLNVTKRYLTLCGMPTSKLADQNYPVNVAETSEYMSQDPITRTSLCHFEVGTGDVLFDQNYDDYLKHAAHNPYAVAPWKVFPEGNPLFHPWLEIPHSLLRGPWSEERLKHLFWFVRAGAEIRWTDSTSGEVALQGLRDAIRTGNNDVLCLLSQTTIAKGITAQDIFWTIRNAGNNIEQALRYMLIMYIRGSGENQEKGNAFASWVESSADLLDSVLYHMKCGELTQAEQTVVFWTRNVESEKKAYYT